MNKAERAEVAKMLLVMAENVGQELSEARGSLLLDELGRFEFEAVKAGLTSILRTARFFPTLAEILEAVGQRPQSELDSIRAKGEIQWQRLLNAPSGASYHRVFLGYDSEGEPRYEQPVDRMDEPAKLAYRSMGESKNGWTAANLDFKRKAFLELYERFTTMDQKLLGAPAKSVLRLAQGVGK